MVGRVISIRTPVAHIVIGYGDVEKQTNANKLVLQFNENVLLNVELDKQLHTQTHLNDVDAVFGICRKLRMTVRRLQPSSFDIF